MGGDLEDGVSAPPADQQRLARLALAQNLAVLPQVPDLRRGHRANVTRQTIVNHALALHVSRHLARLLHPAGGGSDVVLVPHLRRGT